jgi:hypothetical protein
LKPVSKTGLLAEKCLYVEGGAFLSELNKKCKREVNKNGVLCDKQAALN